MAASFALIRPLLVIAGLPVVAACSLLQPAPAPGAAPAPAAAVSAPATAPAAAAPAAAPPAGSASPAPAPATREYRLGPAAQSLVSQARAQEARGELPAASTTLDRALRIEPHNPLLWIELARLRLAESDLHQAEACARKALALAAGDPAARAQSGRVLADALRAQHRNQEARDLEAEPWMH
jgi:tetratricopeptide (TPR) repeat protein